MLVFETLRLIVCPEDCHMGSAALIGCSHKLPAEVGTLDRALDHELLAFLEVHALLDKQLGIAGNLGLEAAHASDALLIRHR
jgi:hypothetical protein